MLFRSHESDNTGQRVVTHKLQLLEDWDERACPDCLDARMQEDADQLFKLLTTGLPAGTTDKLLICLLKYVSVAKFHGRPAQKSAKQLHQLLTS